MPERPEIVCLCGSARFADEMSAANRELTPDEVAVLGVARSDGDTCPTR